MWCLRSELGVLHWEVENYLFFSRFLSNFQYKLVHKVLLDKKLLYIPCTIQQQAESLLAWLMLLRPDPEAGRIRGEACGCSQAGQLTNQQKQGARPRSLALQRVWWCVGEGKGLILTSQDGKICRCIASLRGCEAKASAGLSSPELSGIVFCGKVLAGGTKQIPQLSFCTFLIRSSMGLRLSCFLQDQNAGELKG